MKEFNQFLVFHDLIPSVLEITDFLNETIELIRVAFKHLILDKLLPEEAQVELCDFN